MAKEDDDFNEHMNLLGVKRSNKPNKLTARIKNTNKYILTKERIFELWKNGLEINPSYTVSYDKLNAKIIKNTLISRNQTIDLHDLTISSCQKKLFLFIRNAIAKKYEYVLVIHGIGEGILAQKVMFWLYNIEEVIQICQAPSNMGGKGAMLVKLQI